MQKKKKPPYAALAALLLCAAVLLPAGCGTHKHTGTLTALKTDAPGPIPCCGVFRCDTCGETYEESVSYKNTGLPVVRIEGGTEGISKTEKVTATLHYDGETAFTTLASLKWQGESSLLFPKKNFSVQFLTAGGRKNEIRLKDAWGKQSKYCLKANWDDYAGARNLVSARLWGELVRDEGKNDRLTPLVNGGAVDGRPVLLYMNGRFQGLYTLNTPKNRWIFGMKKEEQRAGLLFAEYWRYAVSMYAQIDPSAPPEVSGWSVEYCATEDAPEGTGWLFDGMNRLIAFVNDTGDADFRARLGDYTDPDRVIDYMLFALFVCGADNMGRNMLWATFDGRTYLPSAYDLDKTWRLPAGISDEDSVWNSGEVWRTHRLFSRMADCFMPEIRARWAALRETLFTEEHAQALFSAHLGQVPGPVRAAEAARWPQEAVVYNNLPDDFTRFIRQRLAALDGYFGRET